MKASKTAAGGPSTIPLDWKARAHLRMRSKRGLARGRRGRIDLGEVVWAIVHRLVPEEALRLERIRTAWEDIATPRIAARTWPALVRHNKLFIDVSDSQWMHELHYGKSALLERLRTHCPQARVDEIKFSLGAVPSREHRPATVDDDPIEPPRAAALSSDPPPETMQALLQIQDPVLRQLAATARLALGRR